MESKKRQLGFMNNKNYFVVLLFINLLFNFSSLMSQTENIYPPNNKVNLLWIHHSTGAYWSHQKGTTNSGYHQRYGTRTSGGNGELSLFHNNYILHHLEYGSQLADGSEYTDYRNWYHKFKWHLDKNDSTYLSSNHNTGDEDLVHCYEQNTSYDEQGVDPYTGENLIGQTNQVIMFKSCFPNSAIYSTSGIDINNYGEVNAFLTQIGQPQTTQGWSGAGGTIDQIQCSYIGLLEIFAQHPDILFVIWVAPPTTTASEPLARDFSDWMVNELLQNYYWDGSQYTNYSQDNVLVFNFWNILTGERNQSFCEAGHNHHRYNPYLEEDDYVTTGDPDFVNSIQLAYSSGGPSGLDSHPASFGGAIAAKELMNRLNIQWNKMHNNAAPSNYQISQNGLLANFPLDSTQTGLNLNSGVSVGEIDSVSCYIFDGTMNAYIDLGQIQFSGNAFSYSYWYRPNDISVTLWRSTTILHMPGVFECNHIADARYNSYINSYFDSQYFLNTDRVNNVIDVNTWTHVAFTWDGDTARHYVDGVQIIENMIGSRTLSNQTSNLFLGNGINNLSGGIRQVLVYDRELSSKEVKEIFMSSQDTNIVMNIPPVAVNDMDSSNVDIPVTIDILSNDFDPDGSLNPSSVVITNNTTNGGVIVDSFTGQVTYTPNSGYIGSDMFKYTVEDDSGEISNEAIVTIFINTINQVPKVIHEIPNTYSLSQNFPNPFNPVTTIQFGLPEMGVAQIDVLDIRGRIVKKILNKNLIAGYHRIVLKVDDLASGVYIYRLIVPGKYQNIQKMIILK
jgi:concanavalin A-like lectin/glucanase superfamily protein/Big-like domain-containing protein/type IX secretion system substrate protein